MELRQSRYLLPILLGFGFRMWGAFYNRGYYHPDEFFNYLEPAFQWAFPEFENRVDVTADISYRSYLIIGFHFSILWLLKAAGLFSPHLAEFVLKGISATLSLGIAFLGARIARYYAATDEKWVLIFLLFWYYFVFFAPHLLSENYATLFVMLAFVQLARLETGWSAAPAWSYGKAQGVRRPELTQMVNEDAERRSNKAAGLRVSGAVWVGVWLSLAFQFRIHTAFFILFPFLALLKKRSWRPAAGMALGFWIPVLAGGLLEWFYRGFPFASLHNYVVANFGERQLILTTASPWYQFFVSYNIQFTEWLFPVVLLFALPTFVKRMPLVGGAVGIFFAAHCFFPHKEVRFLFPMTPLLCIGFVLGVCSWWRTSQLRPPLRRGLLVGLFALVLGAQVFQISNSTWSGGKTGDACALLEIAGADSTATQVSLVGYGFQCGYFSLGRDIPLRTFTSIEDIDTAFSTAGERLVIDSTALALLEIKAATAGRTLHHVTTRNSMVLVKSD